LLNNGENLLYGARHLLPCYLNKGTPAVRLAGKVFMKSVLTKVLAAAIGVAPLAGLTGCSYHARVADYPAHGEAYVYEPGYYYDREYYDPAGHFHDRHYYYYDGHHWDNRNGVPSGFTAHEAHERHDEHRGHDVHRDHDRD
jgi:hypothetical protein